MRKKFLLSTTLLVQPLHLFQLSAILYAFPQLFQFFPFAKKVSKFLFFIIYFLQIIFYWDQIQPLHNIENANLNHLNHSNCQI